MEYKTMSNSAYLEVILGGMYAGKTSRLIEIYKKCNFCNIPVAVINHSIDKRYDETLLSTHDKQKIPCIQTDSLLDLVTDFIPLDDENGVNQLQRNQYKVMTSEVILINEGQFFAGLVEFVNKMLKYDKKVYVCGLDGDFQRNKFGDILDLIPMCDKVTKLTSLCALCKDGTPGIFTKRTTNDVQQTLVGSDIYIPVCRKCY